MKNTLSLILVIMLVLSSCANRSEETRSGVFSLEDLWNSEGSVMLSDIAGEIEYVPLQHTDDNASILPSSNSINVRITQNYIISYGRENLVKVFSRKGEFLRVLGGKGKGPGEYLGVTKILLTPDENLIWIYSHMNSSLFKYSMDGEFLGEIDINTNVSQTCIDPDGNLYLMHLEYYRSQMDSSKIQVVTEDGKEINQYPVYEARDLGPGRRSLLYIRLFFNDGAVEHFEPPYDTLFRYENGKWISKWVIDCGPNRIPEEAYTEGKFNDIFQTYSFVSMLLESPDYFFIRGVHKQRSKLILAEKSNMRVRPCEYKNEKLERPWKYQGLINDIDGGIPFWPRTSFEDRYLATLIDPIDIIDFEPAIGDASEYDKKHRVKLDKMMEDIDIEGNPVVMIVKLK